MRPETPQLYSGQAKADTSSGIIQVKNLSPLFIPGVTGGLFYQKNRYAIIAGP